MLVNKRFKRLGDFAAGTLVVHADVGKKRTNIKIPEEAPVRIEIPLSSEEQKAIVSYAERVPTQSMP